MVKKLRMNIRKICIGKRQNESGGKARKIVVLTDYQGILTLIMARRLWIMTMTDTITISEG